MSDQIITKEGYEKMKKELDNLLEKRKEIAERIQRAKEMGDLNENAEYVEAKEAQAFNEGRVAELTLMLKSLTIVENGGEKGIVGMGSKVRVRTGSEEKIFTIVSFNEADPLTGKISNESPLGKAFIDKKKGDKVVVSTPRGEAEYEILDIE